MKFVPYLNFNGDCADAFRFYEKLFGGRLELLTHGDAPIADEVPAEWHPRIMHAMLEIGDQMLMASDAPPDRYDPPGGLYISIQIDDVARAERIFGELASGGTVVMPFERTFWVERFGMVRDRFGTPWMINAGAAA